MFRHLNKKALRNAILSSLLALVVTVVGSLNLQNFDAALMIYFFGTIAMVFGIAYRFTVWTQRPPTKIYRKRAFEFLWSKDFLPYLMAALKLSLQNIAFQKYIYPRGKMRWFGHFMLATGCLLSFGVTFSLTFGWLHFSLAENSTTEYVAHAFGFPVMEFTLGTIIAFLLFHILVWTAIMVIIGSVIMMHRRLVDEGVYATQWIERDWVPLFLLIAVSATGLGIWFDYSFLEGKMSQFMAVTHAITVALFLMWIPYGKFFHIFQRPAQVGAILYRTKGKKDGMAICKGTQEPYTSQLHIDDLKLVTKELGFDYTNEQNESYLDLSPEGKRNFIARAHLKAREESGSFFG